MQEGKRTERYALFRCERCETHWPAAMPEIGDDWPECCGTLASLLWALVPEYMHTAEILHRAAEFFAG